MNYFSMSCFRNVLAKMVPVKPLRARTNSERKRGRISVKFCPGVELLEDRSMPSLITSQVLPIIVPPLPNPGLATVNTVTVLAPALSEQSPTQQFITLTDTISGAPTGGFVTFTLPDGSTIRGVPVVNGVAQVVDYPIPAGTPAGRVSATYTGTTGFAGSTTSGNGRGTLAFCTDDSSIMLGTTLQTFAILAGSTVTSTGGTVIVGNVGVFAGSAVIGLVAQQVTGTIYATGFNPDTSVPQQAQSDLTSAFNILAGLPSTPIQGGQLGGLTLTPGVYSFSSTAELTGTLTLNNQNDPDALFVFQIGSSLTTASDSRVLFINGGADNVYWQVGSSATLGSATVFAGNILADQNISLDSTASIACGRALASIGAVTLINNYVDPAPHEGHAMDAAPTTPATSGPTVVVSPAWVTLVSGKTTRLSARGSDSTGTATLRYSWSIVSKPAAVPAPTFSANGTNSARDTTVTFRAAGAYTFRLTVTNKAGLSTTSDVNVMVKQALTSIKVTSPTATVHRGQSAALMARGFDQFGTSMLIQPAFSWSMSKGPGSVSNLGLYTAPKQGLGLAVMRISVGQVTITKSLTVIL